jgi:ABC-type branched-subunit amino acid transport system ATPase component
MSYFKVEHLTVRFGGLTAVDDVSFDVDEGQVFTIIGPNGAGKTTLFNLISRLYQPTTGRIEFRGEDVTRLSAQQIAGRGIARTFQNIELFESASTLQNLLVGRRDHAVGDYAIEPVGAAGAGVADPGQLHRRGAHGGHFWPAIDRKPLQINQHIDLVVANPLRDLR